MDIYFTNNTKEVKMMKRKISVVAILLLFYLVFIGILSAQEPPAPAGAPEIAVKKDEKISLDLKGVEISELLKILSQKTGWNIVPSKAVTGRVNVFLNDVTFADALDVILISNDLAADRRGGIIYIMTADEYLKMYGQRYNEKRLVVSFTLSYAKPKDVFTALDNLKSEIGRVIVDESSGTIILMDIPERIALMRQKAMELDRPKETEIFDLQYARAVDLTKEISPSLTEGVGELRVDERTNRIMVSDLPEKMNKIKRMVKAFDREHNEVFIEGEIVQITLNKQFQRGINWEAIVRGMHALDFKGNFPLAGLANYQQVSIGTLATDDYTQVFQLLQTYGDAKVISRPRIAAIDNQEAKILVGSHEAYSTATVSQGGTSSTVTAENVEFIDVGVKLSVIPQVNKDGFVTMKIKPEVSAVRDYYTTPSNNKIPNVETSQAETVVKVKDGSMIMIAGLMKEEKHDDRLGVPVLSKIPLIGAIFSNRATQSKKTELIIFITPHIMTGESSYIGTEGQRLPQATKVPAIPEKIEERLKGIKEDYEQ